MIIDTNKRTTPQLSCLRQNGVDTVIRYYCSFTLQPDKQLTRAEADALVGAGMKIGAVYQGAGNQAGSFSHTAGLADGAYARRYASTVIGQPGGSAIYFAVDYDASAAEVANNIVPYFRAVQQSFAPQAGQPDYRIGVYGSGLVCQALLNAGLVTLTWVSQSSGFRGTPAFLQSGRWNLRQRLPSTLCGLSVDPDESNPALPDFGAFATLDAPGMVSVAQPSVITAPVSPTMADQATVRAAQEKLTALGYALGAADGIYGPLTREALLAFQADNRLPPTGAIDLPTLAALDGAPPRPLSRNRLMATADDLRAKGSEIIAQSDNTKRTALFASILGALGIGNSATVQMANNQVASTAAATAGSATTPASIQPLIQQVLANPAGLTEPQLAQLREAYNKWQGVNLKSVATPENVQALEQLRALIPQNLLSQRPELAKIFEQVDALRQLKPQMQTIFDVLPSFFTDGNALNLVSKGLAVAAGSIIPGFGGSLAVLGIGLAANFFGNKIIQARVQDHKTGAHTGR